MSSRGAPANGQAKRNILLDVPKNVSVEVLRVWLPLSSVAEADQAHCQQPMRRAFLELLSEEQFCIEDCRWLHGAKARSFVKWVLKRKVKVRSIALNSSPAPADAISFFQHVGRDLRDVKLETGPTTIALAGALCGKLETAEIIGCNDSQALGIFLNAVQSRIHSLSFSDCSANTDKCFQDVRLPKVTVLKIDVSFDVRWIQAVLERSPALETLAVREGAWSSGAKSMNTLPTQSTNLKCLILENTRNIPAAAFAAGLPSLSQLQVLALMKLTALTDAIVQEVVLTCPHLYALSLDGCTSLTDASLQTIAANCATRLKHFDISNCTRVTLNGLKHLATLCDQLVDLSMRSTGRVTLDDTFVETLRLLPGLTSLDIGGSALAPACVRALARDLPHLSYLGLCDITCSSRKPGIDYIARHAPCLRTVRVVCGTGMFTDLACNLWESCCPGVKLVTGHGKTPFWSARDFAQGRGDDDSEDSSSDEDGDEEEDSDDDDHDVDHGFEDVIDGSEHGDY
jgi:hypothetical protein